jgi:hypothetical protein
VPRGLSAEAEATDGDLELDHKVDSTQVLKKKHAFRFSDAILFIFDVT